MMRIEDLDLKKQYSLADYWNFKFDRMVELVKGFVINMAPAPAPYHQSVSRYLTKQIEASFPTGPSQLYYAPLDVFLAGTDSSKPATVIQPDLLIVCDPKKITSRGCEGAPDWIAEILSPGSARRDYDIKFHLYESAGVREYWIVDPANQAVETYLLDDSTQTYQPDQTVIGDGTVRLKVFESVSVDIKEIFRS